MSSTLDAELGRETLPVAERQTCAACGAAVYLHPGVTVELGCPACGERVASRQPGAREPEPRRAGSASRKPLLVTIARTGGFRVPQACSCCLGPAEQEFSISAETRSGATRTRFSLSLPSCRACTSHRTRRGARWLVLIGAWFTIAGGLTVLSTPDALPALPDDWRPWIGVVQWLGVMLTLLSAVNLALPPLDRGTTHACEWTPARVHALGHDRFTLAFSNVLYGARFASANGTQGRLGSADRWPHSFMPLRFADDGRLGSRAPALVGLAVGLWLLLVVKGLDLAVLLLPDAVPHAQRALVAETRPIHLPDLDESR